MHVRSSPDQACLRPLSGPSYFARLAFPNASREPFLELLLPILVVCRPMLLLQLPFADFPCR